MKYYIASRLENAPAVIALRAKLYTELSWVQTYDWTTHGSVQTCTSRRMGLYAQAEAAGVAAADILIVLLPGGRGTHCEIGMALALGKKVYILSTKPEVDFGSTTETCAFYHHPLVRQATSETDLMALLRAGL